MNSRIVVIGLTAALTISACEQATQKLPYSVEMATSKTIPPEGGMVSSPAGVSLRFPAGSLASATTVVVTGVPAPAAAGRSGRVGSQAFRLEPEGAALARRATLEMNFHRDVEPGRSWLATVVTASPAGVRAQRGTRVDLGTGIAQARIGALGTAWVVIPHESAVFRVSGRVAAVGSAVSGPFARHASLAGLGSGMGTDSLSVHCGDPDDWCEGLEVTASQNLLDMVEDAAVVFPLIAGTLRFEGSGGATGAITAEASLRAHFKSGQTAETLEIDALLEPTAQTQVHEDATAIVLTEVRHRISGEADSGTEVQEEVTSLTIPKNGGGAFITISRSFTLRGEGGELEPAEVSLTFPVELHP